jgi:hypothetical protein
VHAEAGQRWYDELIVPMHDTIAAGTMSSIIRQSKLDREILER